VIVFRGVLGWLILGAELDGRLKVDGQVSGVTVF